MRIVLGPRMHLHVLEVSGFQRSHRVRLSDQEASDMGGEIYVRGPSAGCLKKVGTCETRKHLLELLMF